MIEALYHSFGASDFRERAHWAVSGGSCGRDGQVRRIVSAPEFEPTDGSVPLMHFALPIYDLWRVQPNPGGQYVIGIFRCFVVSHDDSPCMGGQFRCCAAISNNAAAGGRATGKRCSLPGFREEFHETSAGFNARPCHKNRQTCYPTSAGKN
jgi:hypothetical protein